MSDTQRMIELVLEIIPKMSKMTTYSKTHPNDVHHFSVSYDKTKFIGTKNISRLFSIELYPNTRSFISTDAPKVCSYVFAQGSVLDLDCSCMTNTIEFSDFRLFGENNFKYDYLRINYPTDNAEVFQHEISNPYKLLSTGGDYLNSLVEYVDSLKQCDYYRVYIDIKNNCTLEDIQLIRELV